MQGWHLSNVHAAVSSKQTEWLVRKLTGQRGAYSSHKILTHILLFPKRLIALGSLSKWVVCWHDEWYYDRCDRKHVVIVSIQNVGLGDRYIGWRKMVWIYNWLILVFLFGNYSSQAANNVYDFFTTYTKCGFVTLFLLCAFRECHLKTSHGFFTLLSTCACSHAVNLCNHFTNRRPNGGNAPIRAIRLVTLRKRGCWRPDMRPGMARPSDLRHESERRNREK